MAERDLVLFDYRGLGFDQPSLSCDLSGVAPADPNMPASCRERLEASGVDLGAYTTAAVAVDVVDLASVLKYPQINLIGNSYGTKVALAIVREHPALIRSVVLDASVPPEVRTFESVPATVDRAFQALFAACAADADCAERYPHLDQQLDTAAKSVVAE